MRRHVCLCAVLSTCVLMSARGAMCSVLSPLCARYVTVTPRRMQANGIWLRERYVNTLGFLPAQMVEGAVHARCAWGARARGGLLGAGGGKGGAISDARNAAFRLACACGLLPPPRPAPPRPRPRPPNRLGHVGRARRTRVRPLLANTCTTGTRVCQESGRCQDTQESSFEPAGPDRLRSLGVSSRARTCCSASTRPTRGNRSRTASPRYRRPSH